MTKISSARARQAILVNDGIPLDAGHVPDHISLFDEEGNRIYFTGTHGIPAGGKAGQVLVKRSDADYDVHWVDAAVAAPGGGPDTPPSEPQPEPVYTVPGNALDSGGTQTPTLIAAQGVKGSEFPHYFDTTDQPLDYQRNSPEVAIWFRVIEPGVVSFDAASDNGSDGYGYLYNAATKMLNPTSDTPIVADDDGAGQAQPRITATLGVGDYILLYAGYNATQWGPGHWTLNPTTTAVLGEDLTGPAPVPPTPTFADVIAGPEYHFSIPGVGVLPALGFDGQPWTSESGGLQWNRGRWLDVENVGTLRITRSGSCTLGAFQAQAFTTNVGTTSWSLNVTAGQRIALFCDTPGIDISVLIEDGAALSDVHFTDRGLWSDVEVYNRNDVVNQGGGMWLALHDGTTSGNPPAFEVEPDFEIATPTGSAVASIAATAHHLWPAEDGLGGWQQEPQADPQIYYFNLRTPGTIQYSDLLKPTEYMQLFNSAGDFIEANYPDDGLYGATGVATGLPEGRYFLVTQDAFAVGTGSYPSVVCLDGATFDAGRNWLPLPTS